MQKTDNKTYIQGYIYDHDLEAKVTGEKSKNPGTPFITGFLSIATDKEALNIIQVHFTYVTPLTSKGKQNATYATLNSIIEGRLGNIMDHGIENAGIVRIDSAIGLNEWYDSKTDELISVKRNEGGFVHQISEAELNPSANARASFEADMLITQVQRMEADEEKGYPEKMKVRGAIFDFRGALLPLDFSVAEAGFDAKEKFESAMNYFESLEASPKNPIFTKVRGIQVSQTQVKQIVEESAFGDAAVRETRSSYKDYIINWAKPVPYEWDTPETILATELTEKMAQREVYLAELKRRRDEWLASQGNALAGGSASSDAGYDF